MKVLCSTHAGDISSPEIRPASSERAFAGCTFCQLCCATFENDWRGVQTKWQHRYYRQRRRACDFPGSRHARSMACTTYCQSQLR